MMHPSRRLATLAVGVSTAAILTSACGSELTGADNDTVGVSSEQVAEDGTVQSTETADCPDPCTPAACTVVRPSNALITDWKDVETNGLFVDNDSFSDPNPMWWETFFGGPYVYPAVDPCSGSQPSFPLTQTIDGVWNIQGVVGSWSGFGLWLAPCMVDMSAYRGVSFTLWGDVGSSGKLMFYVHTSEDMAPAECSPNVGTCNPATQKCSSPSKAISVPAAPGEPFSVLWSDLGGGSPAAGVNPSQIVGLMWNFDRFEWGGVSTPPYPVDVSVGEIRLLP